MSLDGAAATLAVFHEVADAVRVLLEPERDWGESGARPGQYLADVDADAAALAVLHDAGYQVLSEESGLTGAPDAPVVVLDPLDGSTNASHRIGWYATSLCLLDEAGPAVALVADQASGARYWAVRGGGAFGDGAPLAASGCRQLGSALVAISGLPASHYGWAQFRAFGASALDLCHVATGAVDAFVDMSVDAHGPWDYLGGLLVCTEAGAVAAEVEDRELVVVDHGARRTPVVAATPELLAAILEHRR